MKSQKTKMIAVAICLSVGMNAFSQDEKQKDKKREKPSLEKMFAKLDQNSDGKLVKEEVEKNKRMTKGFDKIDADADGGITLEEFKTFFEEMRKKREARLKEERPNRDWGNDGGNQEGEE